MADKVSFPVDVEVRDEDGRVVTAEEMAGSEFPDIAYEKPDKD